MKSDLDIRSPKGQENEKNTRRASNAIVEFFSRAHKCFMEELHDDHPADCVLRSAGTKAPLLLIEIKSRSDFDEAYFWDRHRGLWLITHSKIKRNIPIAKSLGVPFVGAMHIIRSKVVLLKIIHKNGVTCKFDVDTCTTQATINGGIAIRENAFLPMHDATRIAYG